MAMEQWWQALTSLEKFFYYIAIPSTVILALQFILTLIGLDGHDADMDSGGDVSGDFDGDVGGDFGIHTDFTMDVDAHEIGTDMGSYEPSVHFDADNTADHAVVMGDFRFITFRGIIAFLTIFGWTGEVVADSTLNMVWILIIPTISGLMAMLFVALMFFGITKLQSSGNISYRNAIGVSAEVYLPIPANNGGFGKVQVLIQERLTEVSAITYSDTRINTGEVVRITDVYSGTALVVERM